MPTKTIWKWEVPIEHMFTLELPARSEFLHFGVQNNKPVLWVLVDPGQLPKECMFRLAGTGEHILEDVSADKYIGSVTLFPGSEEYVLHLFLMGWGSMAG